MGDAVIYAWREEQGDVWTGEWALDRKDKWVPAEANKYILATPEALAASPEVAKLIEAAVVQTLPDEIDLYRIMRKTKGRKRIDYARAIAAAIRSEATK